MLRTNKEHISYSEVKAWLECAYRHKLIHVDKLGKFEPGIYADIGHVIHGACEVYLRTRVMDVPAALKEMERVWNERQYPGPNWPNFKSAVPDLQYWLDSVEDMLNSIPDFLEKEFPGWECVDAEELLMEKIEGTDVSIKGFIDGIIKTTAKNGKVTYHIIDWKNANNSGWHLDKKRDFNVQLQLILYKIYWSKKHNIPLKDVRCTFIFLRRHDPDSKKRLKARGSKRCSSMTVSVGPKTADKAMKILKNMITSLEKGLFLKNRFSCMFCEFYKTANCK